MKETPIFEEVFMRLIRQPGFGLELLIGGLLSFVPIVNIFAFGYLYRFSRKTRATGHVSLPEWTDWRALFFDGLRFGVVWLAYWLLPIFLMSLLSGLLATIRLGAISYLVISITVLISPILFSSALYRLQMRSDFKDLLDVALIFRMTYIEMPRFVIPAFVFLRDIRAFRATVWVCSVLRLSDAHCLYWIMLSFIRKRPTFNFLIFHYVCKKEKFSSSILYWCLFLWNNRSFVRCDNRCRLHDELFCTRNVEPR